MSRPAARSGLVSVVAVGLLLPSTAFAVLTRSASVGSNVFTTGTLQPPTSLSVSARCSGLLSLAAEVRITWTATTSAFADGYDIQRKTGSGSYGFLTHVSPRTTTGYTDDNVSGSTTYTYRLVSTRNSWTSGFSNTDFDTTPLTLLCIL